MCEAQNAVNPDGFTSILTKLQQKILVSKSDSSLNALTRVKNISVTDFALSHRVSMILCNSIKGYAFLEKLKLENAVTVFDLSLENAVENNGCLRTPSTIKAERDLFFHHLRNWDFNRVVNEHLTPKKKWIFDLYYKIPKILRDIVRMIMDKKMRYE